MKRNINRGYNYKQEYNNLVHIALILIAIIIAFLSFEKYKMQDMIIIICICLVFSKFINFNISKYNSCEFKDDGLSLFSIFYSKKRYDIKYSDYQSIRLICADNYSFEKEIQLPTNMLFVFSKEVIDFDIEHNEYDVKFMQYWKNNKDYSNFNIYYDEELYGFLIKHLPIDKKEILENDYYKCLDIIKDAEERVKNKKDSRD